MREKNCREKDSLSALEREKHDGNSNKSSTVGGWGEGSVPGGPNGDCKWHRASSVKQ